jgi:aminopeptidase N
MDVIRLREEQLPEDLGPLAHAPRPGEYQKIENFYTPTVYRKGAEVVRVLHALIGRDAFDKGMQLYFERCDGMAATLEDFVACFEEASGRDLRDFFRWYEQAGTPTLSVQAQFDEEAQRLVIEASQTNAPTPGQPDKKPVPIPLKIGFIDETGAPVSARLEGENFDREEHDVVLSGSHQRFTFEGVARRPIPAVLRGYQAPVTLDQKLPGADRLVQMAHDADPFTRWEAGRTLMTETILAHVADGGEIQAGGLIEALRKEASRREEDAAFVALALQVPTLNRLIHAMSPANPEALHRSREALKASIARDLEEDLLAIASAEAPEAADVGHEARARRALRGSALDLLARRGARHEALLFEAFSNARGMTEKMNALRALSVIDGQAWQEALRLFLEAHRRQPLVVDKWFSVQAASPAYDAEKRVRTLAHHELFTLQNPNRVRSLYATFGQSNQRAFNAPDGSGYQLLAEAIGAVDQRNPMVAARLARSFDVTPLMEQGRWRLASHTIQAMLDARNLSPNVTEILSKIVEYRAAA